MYYLIIYFCSYYDTEICNYIAVKNADKEDAVIDSVKYCGNFKMNAQKTVCITVRINVSNTNDVGEFFL